MESTKKVSLKLLIDREGGRVLFGEAGKDLVDFLFQIFSLPLGTVVSLLSKDQMVGCLGKLYGSVENLDDTYIRSCANKNHVLNPKTISHISSSTFSLLGDSASSTTRKLYGCPRCRESANVATTVNSHRSQSSVASPFLATSSSYSQSSHCDEYVADDPQAICPRCNSKLYRELKYVAAASSGNGAAKKDEGGFVKSVVTYMIMDDLQVKPMSSISSITLLNTFKVKDLGSLEEKDAYLGMDEGLKLLKASLQSKTVLSDVFLGRRFTECQL